MLFDEHLVRAIRSGHQVDLDRALVHARALPRRRRRRLLPDASLPAPARPAPGRSHSPLAKPVPAKP